MYCYDVQKYMLINLFLMFHFSEAPVRSHLKNVYASLACSIFSAAAGAYVHLFTGLLQVSWTSWQIFLAVIINNLFFIFFQGGGLLLALAGFGLAMSLHMTPDNGKNRGQRMAMLLGFAFLSGTVKSRFGMFLSLFC